MQWLTDLINKLFCFIPRIVLILPNEMGLRITLGNHYRVISPGWYLYFPLLQQVLQLTVTPQVIDLKSQSLTTSDNKGIIISGAVEYGIRDVAKALLEVCNLDKTLPTLCLGKIAEYVETHTANECTTENIKNELRKEIMEHVNVWGIKLHHVYLTDRITARSVRVFLDLPPIMLGRADGE
jgi:regulator of protease activity HflC (stomatin/prohibitin superfamily)